MKKELLKKILIYTVYISLIIQFLTGFLDIFVYIIKKKESNILLIKLLLLELLVQVVEGTFYIWLAYYFNNISNVTPKRYFDWFITTPTMLFTICVYLEYIRIQNHNKEINNESENYENLKKEEIPSNLYDIFLKYKNTFFLIFLLNTFMLIFGYLGEAKIINTITGVILGFIPFLIYFYMIYANYVRQTTNGWKLCLYFFFFWGLYGVAALLPYYLKNTFYNILDLFAKNFFGLFLTYIIVLKSFFTS